MRGASGIKAGDQPRGEPPYKGRKAHTPFGQLIVWAYARRDITLPGHSVTYNSDLITVAGPSPYRLDIGPPGGKL